MDPISASALVALITKVFDGATGQVGAQLWGGLTKLVGRSFGRRSKQAAAALDERRGDPEAIRFLAEALSVEAERDQTAAVWLRDWMTSAERALHDHSHVNKLTGNTVYGPVIQARNINIQGDIRG